MMMVDTIIVEFDIANHSFKNLSLEELVIDPNEKNKIYWIHCDLNQEDAFKKLTAKLFLPDDVVRLCHQTDGIPILIDRDESLTIQIQCLLSTELTDGGEVDSYALVMHLTNQFCFTASRESLPVINEFISTYTKSVRYAKTPCFILFLLFDNAINDYAKMLYNFELVAEQMDLDVRVVHSNMYSEVIAVKQQVMKVKRHTIAAREILMRISGRKISVVSEQCRTSLYNLSNHTHMVVNESDSIRDMLNSLLDQIENTIMQKMSESMKILTAFAAIFLPLSLITGIYGMNFHWMPELQWKYGYYWALTLLVLCAALLLYFFKRKKWF